MEDKILNHLQTYGKITSWEAITKYRCTRLSQYILILRKEYNISDRWLTGKNIFGENTKWKEYIYGGKR